jgi:hypothetical protein
MGIFASENLLQPLHVCSSDGLKFYRFKAEQTSLSSRANFQLIRLALCLVYSIARLTDWPFYVNRQLHCQLYSTATLDYDVAS